MKALLPRPIGDIKSHSMEYYKEQGAFETRPIKMNRAKHSTNPKLNRLSFAKPKLDVQGVKDISNNATETKYRLASEASNEYYNLKWGSQHCNWNSGKIEFIGSEYPVFDINNASMSHRHDFLPQKSRGEVPIQKKSVRVRASINRGKR